jgi:ribonuclease HII
VAADGRTARIEFTVGGESRTPVAIASMTAKYVRERAMECFNRYWSTRQPGLRPTAGYPLDANRWRSDAAATIAAAGIDASMLWRRA